MAASACELQPCAAPPVRDACRLSYIIGGAAFAALFSEWENVSARPCSPSSAPAASAPARSNGAETAVKFSRYQTAIARAEKLAARVGANCILRQVAAISHPK